MNKAYKCRIYPDAEQGAVFVGTFGCVRFFYSRMLSEVQIEEVKPQGPHSKYHRKVKPFALDD